MSIESAKDFCDKIEKDDALRAKLEAATKEDRPQIIKDAGFDFTKEEVKQVVTSSTELSADDLANVTGGTLVQWAGVGVTAAASAF